MKEVTIEVIPDRMPIRGGLVLTRRYGEEVWINGGAIKIRVIDINKGRCVRLQIKASEDVHIIRPEALRGKEEL